MPIFKGMFLLQADSLDAAMAQLTAISQSTGGDLNFDSVAETAEEGSFTIYTDGGCLKAGELGAWAFTVYDANGDKIDQQVDTDPETTNNRMEMTAVIRALESLEVGPKYKLYSDSEYVIKGCTQWARNWVRNGWKTRAGGEVLNRDLWEELLTLYKMHDVTLKHVKGHSGHDQNEECDALCTAAMEAQVKDGLEPPASLDEALKGVF